MPRRGPPPPSRLTCLTRLPLALPQYATEDPTVVFQLLEKLGEGSYGSVYQARALRSAFGGDVKPGDVVAIKIVPVEKEQDELLNEISILEQCKSVYITRYFGSYMKDEDCWIVMEFCGAGSVNDIMVSAGITLTEDIISVRRLFLSSFRFRRRPSVALSWELVE
jgi:serine/threonine protein kinase